MIVCPACASEIRVPVSNDSVAHPEKQARTPAGVAGPPVPTRERHSLPATSAPTHSSHDDDDGEPHDEDSHPPHPKKKKFMDDTVDMTAMVDVTFLLLIFFMVTASFAAQKVFEASPPEQQVDSEVSDGVAIAAAIEDVATESVVVEIDAEDRMKIEDQTISSLFELREVLANKLAAEGKAELLIEADYDASHGMVVAVTDAAMDVGMQKIRRLSQKSE